MRAVRGSTALLILLVGVSEVRAQYPFFPSPWWGGYAAGGLSFGVRGRHHHFAFGLSGGYRYGYFAPFPYYAAMNRVTIIQYYAPPPIIVPPMPLLGLGENGRGDFVPPLRRPPGLAQARVPQMEEQPDPPIQRGRRIAPRKAAQAPQPDAAAGAVPPGPRAMANAKPQAPPAKPKPREEWPPPIIPEDPKIEHARLIAFGKTAFAKQEYGRALQRFQQASQRIPPEPQSLFFLAQAQFALGKYQEAVASIQAGMRLRPDWPTAPFRPRELYEANVAEWTGQLQRLQQTLARHPQDADLLFLYAYELWFDGRQEEARLMFQRAAAVAPDRSFIERFLRAGPNR